jgi:hypothetical protein
MNCRSSSKPSRYEKPNVSVAPVPSPAVQENIDIEKKTRGILLI